MTDVTHENVQIVGRHIPEEHSEVVSAHERRKVQLPGIYELGALIEGAFIPLARLKAAEVFEAIERAVEGRKADEQAQPPATTPPPAPAVPAGAPAAAPPAGTEPPAPDAPPPAAQSPETSRG